MPGIIDLRKRPEPRVEPKFQPKPEIKPEPRPVAPPVVYEPTPIISDNVSWSFQQQASPKGPAYIISAGLIGLAIVAGIFLHDILFTIVLVIAALALILSSHRKSQIYEAIVDDSGIKVFGKRYFYSEVKSFWLNYQPPHVKELSLEFLKKFQPRMVIPLEDSDPLEIRRIMVSLVPEKEHEETVIDQIVRRLSN